jgi:hypothetical protein
MLIIWWSKHVGVILSVLVCDIWIDVLLQTSALVGPLYIVNWNARWNSEMFVTCALIGFYKRILLIVVVIILYCNGILLGSTASIIWGTLHYVILNSTFYLSSIFRYWHFCKYFLQNKIKIGGHKSWGWKHICRWLKYFSYKFLNSAAINACKH